MRPLLVALFAAVFTLFVDAQQVSETVEVRLIEVDAVVTDRNGNPVSGLTAADFELFENGRAQTITNFAEYRESVDRLAPASPTAEVRVAPPAPRTIVLFIDSLAVRANARVKLFENLRTLVARTMREGDRAQVLTWHDRAGVTATTPLTRDRQGFKCEDTALDDPFSRHYSPLCGDDGVMCGHLAQGGRGNVAISLRRAGRDTPWPCQPNGVGWAARPGVASAGDSCASWPRLAARPRRDERSRLRCCCAALRQLQRGFSTDDERAGRRRPRAWSRAAGVGTPDALRGWSVPLTATPSTSTTNCAAPGGAR